MPDDGISQLKKLCDLGTYCVTFEGFFFISNSPHFFMINVVMN